MNNSDDSEEENPIRYGTPLEPLEEDEIPAKRKYQQPSEQIAVDAHGRRRFHGAFTGGFSAGYGNTVGTPEGWTPSTFKSSRSEKATVSSQRPEDFMDEDDREEFGIAPRLVQTQHEFTGRKRPAQQRYFDGAIPGEPVLEQLLRPVHETVAVKMLRAMGWREGRGTGGKVSKEERRKARAQHKVYGCHIPDEFKQITEEKSDESSDSEFDYDQLFEPEDYEPYILTRKTDTFGLGYSGLSRHSVLGNMSGEYGSGNTMSHLKMKEKGKKVSIRGQAFGVGAFENEDQDIYAVEDISHYDFEMGGPSKPVENKNKIKGSNVLPGFVKAMKPNPAIPSYPPPALPRDYRPGVRRSRFEPSTEQQRNQALGRHDLTAEARGQLLGETPVPETNIQTHKQPEALDIIAQITGRNINFTETDQKTNVESSKSNDKSIDFIPIQDTGKNVVNVFKPFKTDPKKQTRYELYLKDKNSVLERDGDSDRLSEWERNREITEFEQAAKLYKPLTGAIGDRFTHASEPDDALNALTAVAKSSINYGLATPEQIDAARKGMYGVMTRTSTPWLPESIVCKRFNVPEIGGARPEKQKEDNKPKVSYSIFSYLESSVHDKDSFTKEQTKFSGSKSIGFDKTFTQVDKKSTTHSPVVSTPNKVNLIEFPTNKRLTVAELFMKESQKDLQEKNVDISNTIEKFDKMDLYKSIFLSDSEDEDDPKQQSHGTVKKTPNDVIEAPKNVQRNTSPPRGIFANINFDELNSWKRNTEKETKTTEKETKSDEKETKTAENKTKITYNETETTEKSITTEVEQREGKVQNNEEALMYGPKIPENLQQRLEVTERESYIFKPTFIRKEDRDKNTIEIESSSSEDNWVEATEKKKNKKKKNKKHKSKHKKSKHKKKDR